MTLYENTHYRSRVWPTLTNAATGRTLYLGPGERAEVEGDIQDPWLKPVKKKKADPTEAVPTEAVPTEAVPTEKEE